MSPRPRLGLLLLVALTALPPVGGVGVDGVADATVGACERPATRVVAVRTSNTLKAALSGARAGDRISLADGRYVGRFALAASGTAAKRIAVCGGPGAVLDGGSVQSGYGFHLTGDHVDLVGFAVTRSQKGVMLDGATHAVLERLTVSDIGDEGIHLRGGTSDATVRGSVVHHTGRRVRSYGEGVYVGTSSDKWCGLTGCTPDRTDRALIQGNRFYALTAEAVDAKEGTTGGRVLDNRFDGAGSSAYSWVDVKGNGWTVAGNSGFTSARDGLSASKALDGWGVGNTFHDNALDVRGPGFGVRVVAGNEVGCDNRVHRADDGPSNVACSTTAG